jgi:prophage regulatory protein
MGQKEKSPDRIVWLTGPKAGQVEPPWPREREITPAIERLIDELAKKAVEEFLAEESRRASGDILIRLPEVMRRVGLTKSSIYARVAQGRFPKPTPDGGVSRWFESEIDAYIEGTKALRDGAEPDP